MGKEPVEQPTVKQQVAEPGHAPAGSKNKVFVANSWDPKANEIFLNAIAIAAPDKRAAYLAEACHANATLRERAESLLHAYQHAGAFLETPAVELVDEEDSTPTEAPGTVIGHYKILEKIGEGGFGVVYLAEQTQPIRRKVALKILKPGMDSRQVIARFDAERQALARMDHPNIARVFGAGQTQTGRPYFAMELVKGMPITDYCDESKLPLRQRLELFVQACHGVEHAHHNGVIHRDIKPSNILIKLHDQQPVVKIIDFGIAKAVGRDLTDKTLFTTVAQVLGTPLYASPEQMSSKQLQVDTRTDVYSLGVLLYELLTGTTPFEKDRLQQVAFDEIRRILREEDPPRPSNRLTTIGIRSAIIAAHRRISRRRLTQTIRGELDWIAMKALEKDRSRRYPTPSALAADIDRYLQNRPVEACPPSTVYRTCKFLRRHAWGAAVSAAGIAALAFIAVGSTLTARRFQLQEQQERQLVVEKEQQRAAAELARQDADSNRRAAEASQREADDRRQEAEASARIAEAARLQSEQSRLDAENQRRAADAAALQATASLREAEAEHQAAEASRLELRRNLYAIQMSKAAEMVQTINGLSRARELLAPWEYSTPDLRGWEWYYLTGIGRDELITLRGHDGEVMCVAWSPDGACLASAGSDQTVRIWSCSDDHELFILRGHTDSVSCVCWSPDGRYLASGGADQMIRIWDADKGTQLSSWRANGVSVNSLSWSPDGMFLASAGGDALIRIFALADGREVAVLKGHSNFVLGAVWSPDGKLIGSYGYEAVPLRIWDWDSKSRTAKPRPPVDVDRSGLGVFALAWNPQSTRLAVGNGRGQSFILDAKSAQPVSGTNVGLDAEDRLGLRAVAWSRDGTRVASGGMSTTVVLRDPNNATVFRTFRGHSGRINSLAFSPDSRRLVSGSRDGTIKIWDATKRGVIDFPGGGAISNVAWSPDATRLATCANGQMVRIWDAIHGGQLAAIPQGADTRDVAWSPDGMRLACGYYNGVVRIWDTTTWKETQSFQKNASIAGPVVWSPEGTRLAVTLDLLTIVWDVAAEREICSLSGTARSTSWSPDGKRLATTTSASDVRIWDAATGARLVTLKGHGESVASVAWGPDGLRIATCGGDSCIRIWDALSGDPIRIIRDTSQDTSTLFSLKWSPDGKRLFTNGGRIWDVNNGVLLVKIGGMARTGAWSPDGLRLADSNDIKDATPGCLVTRSPLLLPALNRQLAANPQDNAARRLRAEVTANKGDWNAAAIDVQQYLAHTQNQETFLEVGRWASGAYSANLGERQPPEGVASVGTSAPATLPSSVLTRVAWQLLPQDSNGYLDLSDEFQEDGISSAYVMVRVYSAVEQQFDVLFSADDPLRLWLNGQMILQRVDARRTSAPLRLRGYDALSLWEDRDSSPQGANPPTTMVTSAEPEVTRLTLRSGWNTLLTRIVRSGMATQFPFRLMVLPAGSPSQQKGTPYQQVELAYQAALNSLLKVPRDSRTAPQVTEVAQLCVDRARLLMPRGEQREAEASLRKMIGIIAELATTLRGSDEIQEALFRCYLDLGFVLSSQARTREALDQALRPAMATALRLTADHPDSAEYKAYKDAAAQNLRPLLWSMLHDPDVQRRYPSSTLAGAELYSQACPDEAVAWQMLGGAYCRVSRWEKGISAMQRSIELQGDGGDPEHWFWLVPAYLNTNNQQVAEQWYIRSVSWYSSATGRRVSDVARLLCGEASSALGVANPLARPAPATGSAPTTVPITDPAQAAKAALMIIANERVSEAQFLTTHSGLVDDFVKLESAANAVMKDDHREGPRTAKLVSTFTNALDNAIKRTVSIAGRDTETREMRDKALQLQALLKQVRSS